MTAQIRSRVLRSEEETSIERARKNTLGNLFGKLKHWKISPQRMKNEIRAEEKKKQK